MDWWQEALAWYSTLDDGAKSALWAVAGGAIVQLFNWFRRKRSNEDVDVRIRCPKGQLMNVHIGGGIQK